MKVARSWYVAVAWLAMVWAVANCLYVYLVLGGARAFRVESAVFILAAVLLPLVARPQSHVARPSSLTPTQNRVLILIAVGLWLLTLVPLVTFPFLSDDFVFLASYKHLSDVLDISHFFRPLFAVVFFLLATVGHGAAAPFHLAALLIHSTSACLIYVLARRLFQRSDAAVLCFAMFLLNPLQLEAVLWASGLQELLWTVFVLSSLVVYTGSQSLSLSRIIGTCLLIACALLSKETAISSILLLPAADWAYFRMRRGSLQTAAYGALALIAVIYLLARARVASIDSAFFVAPGTYFAKQFVGAPYKFFVQPWNLQATPVSALLLCCASIAAIGLVFWAVIRGAGPMALAGPAVILISTLPVYSYFYVAPDLRGARYLYFPTVGWTFFAAQLLFTVFTHRRTFGAAIVGVVLISFVSLHVNLGPWRTAGEIVANVETAIKEGRSPEASSVEWQKRYGQGLELKDGLPYVYKGVYLFVNGYPELRDMLTTPDAARR